LKLVKHGYHLEEKLLVGFDRPPSLAAIRDDLALVLDLALQ
jgi:hypothetical protein